VRIGFLARSLNVGGAERQLILLANGLADRGHGVAVFLFYASGAIVDGLRPGVQVYQLDKGGRWDIVRFARRLNAAVRQFNPEVLHGYLPIPNLLTCFAKLWKPTLRSVWGVRASNVERDSYDRLGGLSYHLEARLSRCADLVIANSWAGKEHALKQGFPKGNTIVIPNGIDTNRFCPDAAARHVIRQEFDIDDRVKLVGLAGRLDPMKDHENFLRAASIVCRASPNARFICIGDGPRSYVNKLRSVSRELGLHDRIIWAGVRTDMEAVYNAIDVGVLSSAYGEGFPNVLGEAMSCGVPCVVTDVGDAAFIVGDAGIVVPRSDSQALAAGITRLLNELVQFDRCRVRQRIVERFSASRLIVDTERALWQRV
jgi:glycosyltransferase involved in cell wall biosynthesis